MSNYYKNSNKDISKQIYVTNNINIKNNFKPIFDTSLNATYVGFNNDIINEKINTTNYLYNNVDICNNCFAVYAEYTSTTNSVNVPTWCSKIRAVLIGGGGGGCSSSNTYSTYNTFVNSSPQSQNFQVNTSYVRSSNGNSQSYGINMNSASNIFTASYRNSNNREGQYQFQNSNNDFNSNQEIVNIYFQQNGTNNGTLWTDHSDLFSNNWISKHENLKYVIKFIKDYPNSNNNTAEPTGVYNADGVVSQNFSDNGGFNNNLNHQIHIHWNYVGTYNTTTTNTINPASNGGGGGGGGGFLYLKDYTANQTMSVTIGGGGGANNSGGETSIVVGTTTVGRAPGGSGTTTSSGGAGGGTTTDDNTKKIVPGSSGYSSTTSSGGAGGGAGLTITDNYGKGGDGGARAGTGSSVTNAGTAGNAGYCRIYFLAN